MSAAERKKSLITVHNQRKQSQVAKAAVLSSAMLARKNSSSRSGPGPGGGSSGSAQFGARESIAAISDMLNTQNKKPIRSSYVESERLETALKIACTISLVTVCLNTPETIKLFWPLNYVILFADFISVVVFMFDSVLRIYYEGGFKYNSSYLSNRWSQFSVFISIIHLLSFLLHVYQILDELFPSLGRTYKIWYGAIRSIRPFIIIRMIPLIVKFKLPKNRIEQLLKRSSQQVKNVTLFFVFFMTLYAIFGIQLFGRMDYHCVRHGTNTSNVTIQDLAIPDTMCSPDNISGYVCPEPMVCKQLNLNAKGEGFYGMFNDFGASVFTVYLAASEEGWVYVLYDCMDSLPSYLAFLYFCTLIFFLAWLVKNVFIAVITETFAEIRIQFSEMWQKKEVTLDEEFRRRLEKTDEGWRLIRLDRDVDPQGPKQKLQLMLRSMYFQCFVIIFVVLNAIANAMFVYKHDESDAERKKVLYLVEVGFTILFNFECLIKILCYGFRNFIRRGIFKFELILCVGSSLNIVKVFYERNYFTYFQTFRLLRLIKASPILEDFVWKIFSPGKKLGGLVIFTIAFICCCSAISLQLFFSVPKLEYFRTFPNAFMSMFQIITQEGWTDFVVEVLRATDDALVPFVALYFVAYHLFVTLIVLSLFVAVILDNLEMDEELKKVKQLKAREATTSMRSTLPWRLRVFEKFPTRPQMSAMKKADSDFPMPKVRGSFTHQFAAEQYTDSTDTALTDGEMETTKRLICRRPPPPISTRKMTQKDDLAFRQIGGSSLRCSLNNLLELSDRTRQSLSNSLSFLPHFTRSSGSLYPRKDALTKSRSMTGKFLQTTTVRNKQYNMFSENGDLSRPSDSAPKKNAKQGEIDIRALQQKRQLAEITRNRIEEDMRENHPFFDRPLFLIGRASQIREFCKKLVHAKYDHQDDTTNGGSSAKKTKRRFKEIRALIGIMPYIDWAMATVIIVSCVSMMFESPWPTTGENLVMNNWYLQICDYIFVLAMTLELSLKIIANGLFFTPKAVVRDVGGFMSLFIYFTSLIFLIWMPKHVEINSLAQFLMICRAMRPLRIYTLVPHIRRVVLEFFRGFKEIVLVTILMIVVMFIFASFGVQIVGGKLAACNDPTVKERENCHGVFWQKLFVTRLEVYGKDSDEMHPKIMVPRVWTNPRNFNFDHVGNAMLALFETLSFKGWNVIRDILSTRHGPWAVVFIHIYVFTGCMIGLTLFVGVVIANYTQNRGTALLTVDQRRWHDLKARLKMAQPLHVPPKPSESARLRTMTYELTMSRGFNQLFALLVVLNSFTLVIPWNVEEADKQEAFLITVTVISGIINILFCIEIILKIIAYTFSGFWQSRRNRVDLLITILGVVWNFLHFFVARAATEKCTVICNYTFTFGYLVVILRFFTIASRNSTLKMLMLTVIMSMFRSFFIITALFLLVLFYAYTGVILFPMVKYGMAVSKHVNFRTASEALVVLFRCLTGEDWNDIMHDCMRSAPFCYWSEGMNYWETDCGNYYGAIIYFCSFYLIITYIVRNLLVAIIMENFSLFYSSEEDALLSYADIRNFQYVWNMVDQEQKRTIPVGRVKFLLRLLKGRLEVDPEKDRILFKHMCYEMDRLHNGEDVSFHDVLYMLSYRSVDIRKSLQLEELLQREELEFIIEEEVAKQTIRTWLEGCLRKMRNPSQKDSESLKLPQPITTTHLPHSSMAHDNDPSQQRLRFVTPLDIATPMEIGGSGGNEVTSSDEEGGDEVVTPPPRRKKTGVKNRRGSIPEAFTRTGLFQEAARKFMVGSSSSEKKHASIKSSCRSPETCQLLPKRAQSDRQQKSSAGSGSAKNFHLQLNVYDLPDVEERGEDSPFSPKNICKDEESHSPLAVTPSVPISSTQGSPRRFAPPILADTPKDIDKWWRLLND
ncbi:unnamed protein product [Caenorhabditis angaria]|uniref:Sodium leak channel NALCN n=1 Tax=Caenorhabditis angaria TaxID=860376 RepID=A0A9P1IKA8_9PELO|nr:unnamed protein product [Caenorhabditis angaria]